MLSNKKNIKIRGFTIVELLIVIVVIAILAAISIVAYNGINKRGKLSSAQSAASQVAKKAGAYQAVKNEYPADLTAFNSVEESKLEGVTIGTVNDGNGTNTVSYARCGTTGARIQFWNYTATSPGLTSDTVDPKSIIVGTC